MDELTLREENKFLEGRRLLHEEVLRTVDETALRGAAEPNLERPDTGEVTREALAQGYRLPGPAENANPDWYYYRSSTVLPGQYELARRPSAPSSAPGLRARVVGDTFTGLVPIEPTREVEIPAGMAVQDVIKHLRATPGFGEYLRMFEAQGLASAAIVDGVIHHKLNLRMMAGKRLTTSALRDDVREHFRQRVNDHLCDRTLSDTASWARFQEMASTLPPTERGRLAETWYRHRHTKGDKGPTRVEVPRTSGQDEGMVQRRVVDAIEGDTAIEIKDITGPIDRDQFGAYMDMLKTPDDGSAPLFKKVKYVFTKP
ncbi:MAG TPA: hypothetical protein PKU97_24550, partial [Kofleriaceae bacterium]|nr:hypothetical protein [Kofleriaceae bacterium]